MLQRVFHAVVHLGQTKAIGRTLDETGRPDVERSVRRLEYLPGGKGRKPCPVIQAASDRAADNGATILVVKHGNPQRFCGTASGIMRLNMVEKAFRVLRKSLRRQDETTLVSWVLPVKASRSEEAIKSRDVLALERKGAQGLCQGRRRAMCNEMVSRTSEKSSKKTMPVFTQRERGQLKVLGIKELKLARYRFELKGFDS